MNKINTPLNEKFNILAYLQREVNDSGSFLISYLKTKKMFQISFVNGLDYKGLSPRIEDCVDLGLNQLKLQYKEQYGKSYHEGYDLIQSNLSLQDKIKQLEERLRESEDKYNKEIIDKNCDSSKHQTQTGFFNYTKDIPEIILDKPKRKRGRPSTKSLSKDAKKLRDKILSPINDICEDYKGKQKDKKNITEKEIIDSPIIWDVSDKKKKELRERTKARSRIFTEKELEKEMRRLNSDLPTTLLLFRNTKKYEIERAKAYKRLTSKKYTKISVKRENLNVSKNKYNITKEDIISDMKRVLKSDFDTLSNIKYIRQWTLAKARVWNREYTKAKKYGLNPWG